MEQSGATITGGLRERPDAPRPASIHAWNCFRLAVARKLFAMRAIDLTGKRFGRLVVIGQSGHIGRRVAWDCRCDCGNSTRVIGCNLGRRNTSSCGCLRSEVSAQRMTVHGSARVQQKTPEYTVWCTMWQRCSNPNDLSYARYGGRGITVCERWKLFENFLADMGVRPTPRHQIERNDNSAPYSPENCRWASPTEQANNRRNNHLLTHDGRTMTIAQWAAATGLSSSAIEQRLRVLGWSTERTLTTPPLRQRRVKRT